MRENVDPLVITLRGLQATADNQHTPASIPWQALNAAGQASGAPSLDYDRFAAQWAAEDDTGILHQLVDRFDGRGLVLKTQSSEDEIAQGHQQSGPSEVSKMAMSATKRGDLA